MEVGGVKSVGFRTVSLVAINFLLADGRGALAILAAIIFGTFYFGKEVIAPIALAILLSFVLEAAHAQVQPRQTEISEARDAKVAATEIEGGGAGWYHRKSQVAITRSFNRSLSA